MYQTEALPASADLTRRLERGAEGALVGSTQRKRLSAQGGVTGVAIRDSTANGAAGTASTAHNSGEPRLRQMASAVSMSRVLAARLTHCMEGCTELWALPVP